MSPEIPTLAPVAKQQSCRTVLGLSALTFIESVQVCLDAVVCLITRPVLVVINRASAHEPAFMLDALSVSKAGESGLREKSVGGLSNSGSATMLFLSFFPIGPPPG